MRSVLGWTMVVVLCCATAAEAAEDQLDARLVEAKTAFDEAASLRKADQYAEAILKSAHALPLREAALGATHPEVATSLSQPGKIYQQQWDMPRAEPLLERALAIRESALGKNHPVVVFADPAYDTRLNTPSSTTSEAPSETQRSPVVERFFSTLRKRPAGHAWTLLPGTRQEAEAIQRLFPMAQLLFGAEATKQRLLQLITPGILHIAAHGFFLDDAAATQDSRAVGHFGGHGGGAPVRTPADPLLRSGLVLAGAQASTTSDSGTSNAQTESSMVTALEFAGLDLWGTQLVVLSACDTGRGDVKLGQGVYGLRRAFIVAGAETVVMSLWKVNDDITRLLMEDYYRHLLAGRGRAEALRDAMRTLRQTHPHPYYWAPFIALGRDAPLQSLTPVPTEQPGQ